MALSLEHQLNKLSAPQTDVFDYRNRKKSILFSDQKAPLIDKETFYDIGLSGITELKEIDSQFNKFDELFDSKAKYFQRSVVSKDDNLALDEKIEKFLLIVSPYLEKQSALKAIEWLIHRFMINEMNVDAIMMCIFPYYESVLFTRIAQVVNFNQHKQWRWLKSCSEGGRPLANLTVYTYWQTDTWFRNFLSNYFKKMVKVNSNEQGVKLAGSMLISTQMGGLSLVLQSHETPREQVASICQTLKSVFGCGQRDVLCGMLLLMAQMTSVFQLSKDINEIIINKIAKMMNRDPSLLSESLLSLMTLCRGQRLTDLPLSAMATILNGDVAAMLKSITDIAAKREVAPFLALYTIGVYEYFLSDQFDQSSDPEAVSEQVEQLLSFLERTNLHQSDATFVISSLLRYFCENNDLWKKDELSEETAKRSWQNVWGAQALRRLALSHPKAFDAAKEVLKSEADGPQKELFKMQNEMLYDATANIEIDSVLQEEPEIAEVKEITEEEMFTLILKGGNLPEGADSFLRGVVSSIKLKNVKVPMAHTFWQLQNDSSDKFSTKIQRLLQVVRVIVLLQASGREKTLCLQLLHVILNKLLQTTQNQLRFLALIFGAEKEENFAFDEAVKLWALKLSTSVIKKWKCRMGSTALPMGPWWASVITPLIESETSLPSAAVELLESVLTTDSADAMVVIKDILKFKEEVVLDCRRLPLALKNSSADAIAEVVAIAFHKDVPTHTRASMLFLVSEVPVEHFCDHLMTLANQILDKAVISDAEASCLHHILKRFDGDLLTKEGSLDLLKKCLESNTQLNVMGNSTSPMKLVLTRKVLGYLRLNQEKANMEMCIFVVEILAENVLKGLAGTEEVELVVDVGIHPSVILELWKRFDLVQKYTSIKEARAKRAKLQHEKKNNNSVSTAENHGRWRKLSITVEILAQMTQIEEPWTLVEPLCDHLNLASTLILPFSDTLQQHLLSAILHVFQLSEQSLDAKMLVTRCKVNVSVMVHCVRYSSNPDTHRRAFLILAAAARYFPEQVLNSALPIVTFMGTSLVRRDDAFSIHVMQSALKAIVPTLVQCDSVVPFSPTSTAAFQTELLRASRVARVLVRAMPDVAQHRRQPLFHTLADTLGPIKYLWIFIVFIAESYVMREHLRRSVSAQSSEKAKSDPMLRLRATNNPTQTPDRILAEWSSLAAKTLTEDEKKALPSDVQFLLEMFSGFSLVDQLVAVRKALEFVQILPDDQKTVRTAWKIMEKNNQISDSTSDDLSVGECVRILPLLDMGDRQLRQLKYTCVSIIVQLFISEAFVAQMYECQKKLMKEELVSMQSLLQLTLSLSRVASKNETKLTDNQAVRFWSAVHRKLLDLTESCLALMPAHVMPALLAKMIAGGCGEAASEGQPDANDVAIQASAIEVLCAKLAPENKYFETEKDRLKPFMYQLSSVMSCTNLPEANRQRAIFAIQLLVRKLPAEFVNASFISSALQAATNIIQNQDSSIKMLCQATLLLAEIVQVAEIQAVAVVSGGVVQSIMALMTNPPTQRIKEIQNKDNKQTDILEDDEDNVDNLVMACVIALRKITRKLPRLLSTTDAKSLFLCGCQMLGKRHKLPGFVMQNKSSSMAGRLIFTLKDLGLSAEFRVILPIMQEVFEELCSTCPWSACNLMYVVKSVTRKMHPKAVDEHLAEVLQFYMQMLDFRQANNSASPDSETMGAIAEGELQAMKAVTKVVMQMNEVNSLDIYQNMFQWAYEEDCQTRLITFYRFSHHLAEKLKRLFLVVKMADLVFNPCVQLLKELAEKFGEEIDSSKEIPMRELTTWLLYTLATIFKFDSVQFTNEDRFKTILKPLMKQLHNPLDVTKPLQECFVTFVRALKDYSLWTQFNGKLMKKLNNSDPKVVLKTLDLLQHLLDTFGQEYIEPMVGDIVRGVSEALEREEPEVTVKARQMFTSLQKLVGDKFNDIMDS